MRLRLTQIVLNWINFSSKQSLHNLNCQQILNALNKLSIFSGFVILTLNLCALFERRRKFLKQKSFENFINIALEIETDLSD